MTLFRRGRLPPSGAGREHSVDTEIVIGAADVVHRDDVRVVKFGLDAGLVQEGLDILREEYAGGVRHLIATSRRRSSSWPR